MKNLADMLRERCACDPDKTAYLVKREGQWVSISWTEVNRRVERLAAGLLALGLEPGDTVSILGSTRLEWALCDLAILRAGCKSVGIYQTLSGEQAAYILKDSGSKMIFVEDSGQFDKLSRHLAYLPGLKRLILWDGVPDGENVLSLEELDETGAAVLQADPDLAGRAEKTVRPEDVAIIIYTSGTTGPPKGACLTHANILAELDKVSFFYDDGREHIMMFFLPLSHVGERVPGHYNRVRLGIPAAFVDDITRVLDDVAEIRPTVFGSVPRIFEKAYARIRGEVAAAPAWKQKLFFWAERVGREASRRKQAGREMGLGLRLRYALADRLVLSKIRQLFGGRVTFFISAAAPIAIEIIEFFHACGMLILEGYGQTEVSCFCTICAPDDYRFGSVGKPLDGVELKIAEDGEIMVKGDIVFSGYLNQPQLTAETLTDDGWIYTGDLGRLDEDGFLWITGRKKEIIITSGGKNVTPANIENILKNHPMIEQAMVHGDKRKYLTALIGLEPAQLEAWARGHGHGGLGSEELLGLPSLHEEIQQIVDGANEHLARFETIKKFIILPRLLEIETGELTPTMKVRRRIVEEKYKEFLDSLYQEE